ncbi:hypothetical protein CKAH01_13915 [Colletotrichum kahawae]|uniref:HEAT repeat domain-containing protein n=1 Tax=Colletotrichum kahawae TaxID=34407 RepID=A0AAD9YPI5_COLKA|nr:hypothetical protein CKAH01_13915 [Colletotrichum kahawae]
MTTLVELFKDEDWHVRESAAKALGNQSTLSDATVAALVELFKDEDSDLTLSDATVAALVELFKHEDSDDAHRI